MCLTVAWKRMLRGKRTKAAPFLTSKFEGATRRESPEYLAWMSTRNMRVVQNVNIPNVQSLLSRDISTAGVSLDLSRISDIAVRLIAHQKIATLQPK